MRTPTRTVSACCVEEVPVVVVAVRHLKPRWWVFPTNVFIVLSWRHQSTFLISSTRFGLIICVGWWSREVERRIMDSFRENLVGSTSGLLKESAKYKKWGLNATSNETRFRIVCWCDVLYSDYVLPLNPPMTVGNPYGRFKESFPWRFHRTVDQSSSNYNHSGEFRRRAHEKHMF